MISEHTAHEHHDHAHGMEKKSLRIAFLLTIVILATSLIGGILAHSLALLSDAGHTLTDLFALGLAWFAASQAERPSNERRTFGYHRVGILAAFLNGASLIVIAVVIIWEAVLRFQHPETVQPFILFVSATLAVVINLIIGFGLQKEKDHSLNVRAAALHVFGDVAVSLAVMLGGLIVFLTGWMSIDPLLSIGVSLFIAFGAWKIVRETTDILLESAPERLSLSAVVDDMIKIPGVKAVHDLHVWCIASGMTALSSHILIDNVSSSASSAILQSVNHLLQQKYQINHTTIQFECADGSSGCPGKDLYCCFGSAKNEGHVHATTSLHA